MPSPLEASLASLPLFQGLTGAEVAEIAALCEPLVREAQQPLFREGEPGDAIYIVLSGTQSVVKRDHAGQHQTLAKLNAPAVLGEMSLLGGDAPRSATVIADARSELLRIPNEKLKALFAKDRPSAYKLVQNLAGVLSRRLRQVDEKLVEVLGHQRREELAQFHEILSRWTF